MQSPTLEDGAFVDPAGQRGLHGQPLVVVLEAEVRDQVLAHDVAQRVLQLHRLDEQIVLGIEPFARSAAT